MFSMIRYYVYIYYICICIFMSMVLRSWGTYDKNLSGDMIWSCALTLVQFEVRKCFSECDGIEELYRNRYSLKQMTSFSVVPGLWCNELTQMADKATGIVIEEVGGWEGWIFCRLSNCSCFCSGSFCECCGWQIRRGEVTQKFQFESWNLPSSEIVFVCVFAIWKFRVVEKFVTCASCPMLLPFLNCWN